MTFLLLNQTFWPDVMATGQYLTEVALRLVERGHRVTVVTSRRAYDHPETLFPKSETWRGVRIYRVGSTGFGKGARWRRAADFGSFLALCLFRLLFLRRHDVVVALTSPPLISFPGAWAARLRRSRFFYWVMDFNPDEAIAAGWLRPRSLVARVLDGMSRFSLRRAEKVIALDRFMQERVVAKGIPASRVVVIPPWSHDAEVRFDAAGRERFRQEHGLQEKFVVMYSGNHSPCHPLDTVLEAAERLASDPGVVFCFVGGGSEWRRIREKAESGKRKAEKTNAETLKAEMLKAEEEKAESRKQKAEKTNAETLKSDLAEARKEGGGSDFSVSAFQPFNFSNILCLPYQPLAELAGSLSAADLHLVVMGDAFVGLVHPCKIYNVLNVGAPVLYIGPRPSHLSEILDGLDHDYPCAAVRHGEVEPLVRSIQQVRREARGGRREPPEGVRERFSRETLLPRLVGEVEGEKS